jgi:hypothetical protein
MKKTSPARDDLRIAIAAKNELTAKAQRARLGHQRALTALNDAEAAVTKAERAVAEAQQNRAATLAEAWAGNKTPAPAAPQDRVARDTLADAIAHREAARTAADKLASDAEEAERAVKYLDLSSAIRAVAWERQDELYAEALTLQKRLTHIKSAMWEMAKRGIFGGQELNEILTYNQLLPFNGDVGRLFRPCLDVTEWHVAVNRLETDSDAQFPN